MNGDKLPMLDEAGEAGSINKQQQPIAYGVGCVERYVAEVAK